MNRLLLDRRIANITNTGLPVTYVYKGETLIANGATVWQKLRFSEWGAENGYEKSILAKCSDFDGGGPESRGTLEIDGVTRRILSAEPDAAGTGVMIHLGAEYYADQS